MEMAQSGVISKIRTIWKRLSDKEYRENFVNLKIDNDLSSQIYALRDQRSLTQEDLGLLAGMAQPRIAKLEASCEGVTLATLKRLASALDVGLSVRFVSFNELVQQSVKEDIDRPLPNFPGDCAPNPHLIVNVRASSPRPTFIQSSNRSPRLRFGQNISSGNQIIMEAISGQQSVRF